MHAVLWGPCPEGYSGLFVLLTEAWPGSALGVTRVTCCDHSLFLPCSDQIVCSESKETGPQFSLSGSHGNMEFCFGRKYYGRP